MVNGIKILNQRNLLSLNETELLYQYVYLTECVAKFYADDGKTPRLGDFVELPDGSMRRLCAQWPGEFQVTPTETSGCFNIDGGSIDYSGSLEPCVDATRLRFDWRYRLGQVWFFKDGMPAAHAGIDAEIPFRVFKLDA